MSPLSRASTTGILVEALRLVTAADNWQNNHQVVVPQTIGNNHQKIVPLKIVGDLREALLSRSDVFVTFFTESLMAYALGRRVEYYDMPAIRQIVRDAEKDGYPMSSFVLGVAKSTAFLMSRTQAATADGIE